MIFTELRFVAFFAVVLAVHWGLASPRARKVWLLAASWAFYAAWDARFLSLILFSTAVDWIVGRRLGVVQDEGRRRRWLAVSVVANLGLLATFKYLDFFSASAADLAATLGLELGATTLDVVLPVGISFYTFQTMSYSIDVYRRELRPVDDPLDLALFVAFFPQLVAGPIVRARTFLPQLVAPRRLADVPGRACLVLFLVGFVKKAAVSDGIAPEVDRYFADPAAFDAASALLASWLYAAQIYCDFSGYSDMAIACAGLLGYTLPANFDHPYLAADVSAFWRRWHISLSSWLRDYLFIPLGGSRGGTLLTVRNLLATMLLGGLWHGAAWRFVIWGGLHGLALVVHRAWRRLTGERWTLPRPLGVATTFWWVGLTWIFFRATTLEAATVAGRAYLTWEDPGTASLGDRLGPVLVGLALLHGLARHPTVATAWRALPRWAFGLLFGAAVAGVLTLVHPWAEPFIYFQF